MNYRHILTDKRSLIIANVVLGIFLLILLILIARDVFSIATIDKLNDGLKPEDKSDYIMIDNFEDYSVILTKNIFGFNDRQLVLLSHAPRKKILSKENQTLDLKLVGAIASEEEYSYAVFLQKNGKQVLYKLNDNIPGIGTLEKIESDRVFVNTGKDVKALDLSDLKGLSENKIKTQTPYQKNMLNSRNTASSNNIVSRDDGSYVLSSEFFEKSIQNPDHFMRDARIGPKYIDGEQVGFQIKGLRRGGIYDKLGLKPGDILKRINEYNITNPESALKAFVALKGVDEIQLDVIRDNNNETLKYYVK